MSVDPVRGSRHRYLVPVRRLRSGMIQGPPIGASVWRRSLGLLGLGCLLALGMGACSDDEEGKGLGDGVRGGGPSIPPSTLTGGQGGAPGGGQGQGGLSSKGGKSGSEMCAGLPFEDQAGGEAGASACVALSTEAEVTPVDLYIIMDRSVSMGYEAA